MFDFNFYFKLFMYVHKEDSFWKSFSLYIELLLSGLLSKSASAIKSYFILV